MAAVLRAHSSGRTIGLRTSGSTGRPRVVVRSPESWVRSFRHVAELTSLRAGARLWLPGPLSATMNLFAATMARHHGVPLVADPRTATHAHLTPLVLAQVLDQGVPLDAVQVTVAGDRLPRSLRARAEAAGAVVSHYYGAAELSFVAWGPDEDDLRPFPDTEVAVRVGEIWVRSPYLCDGYAGHAGPLRRDADGYATVGDRGALVDGRLSVHGRGEEAVTTAGATVLVADVEHALRARLRGSAVIVALPHPSLGQVVGAVLTDPTDLSAASEHAQLMEPAQRPRRWFHVPTLPLTSAGKVDRTALARQVTGPDAVPLVPRRRPGGPR